MSPIAYGPGYPADWQRAHLSDALVEEIRRTFRLEPVLSARDLGGEVSLNVHIRTAERSVVARVHRAWMSRRRLQWQRAAASAAAAQGIPVPASLAGVGTAGGRLVELEEFIDDDQDRIGVHEVAASWSLLARLHRALRAMPPSRPRQSTWCPPPRLNRWLALSAGATGDGAALARRAGLVGDRLRRWWAEVYRALPRTVIHGDYHGRNLLFRGGRIVGVLDFGFSAHRPRVFDLATSWLHAHLGHGRTRRIEAGMLPDLLNAYNDGAQSVLSPLEWSGLPMMTALAALYWTAEAHRMADVDAALRNEAELLAWAESLVHDCRF